MGEGCSRSRGSSRSRNRNWSWRSSRMCNRCRGSDGTWWRGGL